MYCTFYHSPLFCSKMTSYLPHFYLYFMRRLTLFWNVNCLELEHQIKGFCHIIYKKKQMVHLFLWWKVMRNRFGKQIGIYIWKWTIYLLFDNFHEFPYKMSWLYQGHSEGVFIPCWLLRKERKHVFKPNRRNPGTLEIGGLDWLPPNHNVVLIPGSVMRLVQLVMSLPVLRFVPDSHGQ